MSSWAKPGVKCVCISDTWQHAGPNPAARRPVAGEICVIEAVKPYRGDTYLNLGGYPLSSRFRAARFRPLVPPKTQEQDVAIFRHHLTDEPIDV